MQAITTGMAAIRAQVRIFGTDSEPFAVLVVAMFIRPSNTAPASGSTALTQIIRRRRHAYDSLTPAGPDLARLGMEKLENLAGAFGTDARNLAEVGDRGPLDLF